MFLFTETVAINLTQNSFTEAGILFTEAVTIDCLGKSIYEGGQKMTTS